MIPGIRTDRTGDRSGLLKRLWEHHLPLAIASAVLLVLFVAGIDSASLAYRWSMATAYVSMGWLVVTLMIGPFNVWRGRRNPFSTDLRRDVAIWAGLIALLHTGVGLQVHMGSMLKYFFRALDGPDAWKLRGDLFGFANYTGMVAALLVLFLLAISNDWSVRLLRGSRWKSLQRLTYVMVLLTIFHGIAYQVLEKRAVAFVWALGLLLAILLLTQAVGMVAFRRRKSDSHGKAA